MADGDSPRDKIRRSLFPVKRTRKPKPIENVKWFRKNAITINAKLRQEIMDVLPFDVDKKQADLILRTIFNTIVEKIAENGHATIPYIGRFYMYARPGFWRGNGIKGQRQWIKPTNRVKFTPTKKIRQALWDTEPDGDSGKVSGT